MRTIYEALKATGFNQVQSIGPATCEAVSSASTVPVPLSVATQYKISATVEHTATFSGNMNDKDKIRAVNHAKKVLAHILAGETISKFYRLKEAIARAPLHSPEIEELMIELEREIIP